MIKKSIGSKQKLALIKKFAEDKLAINTIALDMRHASNFCDYFIITEGDSGMQLKAISDSIVEGLEKEGFSIRTREGDGESGWVLIDTIDVMVHIFNPDTRKFYDLERLWFNAKKLKLS